MCNDTYLPLQQNRIVLLPKKCPGLRLFNPSSLHNSFYILLRQNPCISSPSQEGNHPLPFGFSLIAQLLIIEI
jgi:hypothetical protein